ncbi:MAG TPA: AraC family ligand binding domain-containing protein, partial [Vicinamibacterales bacterium]|nr:AraC family ligand binding domain-containing protein [Vicinamibacterales bacterium]
MSSATPPKNFTHGTILRWRRVPGLVLAEVEYEPGLRVPSHIHANARLVLVLSGSVTEIRGSDTATFGPSTLLLRRADEPHAYAIGERGATCLVVDVDPAWLGRAREQAPVLESSAAFRGGLVV